MPQPDIFITARRPGEELVAVDTVLLIVEVASTTLDFDLGRKLRLYAEAGIPEYWVADVNGQATHQMWSPRGKSYAERREIPFGEPIAAETIVGLDVSTATLA